MLLGTLGDCSGFSPLPVTISKFPLVFLDKEVDLAQGECSCHLPFSWLRCSAAVICLCSESSGLNGKRSAVSDVSGVTALSCVDLQVFGHGHGRWFTRIPAETTQLQTMRFALLPQGNLPLLPQVTVQLNRTQLVEVSSEDIREFDTMVTQKKTTETALEVYKEK